MLEKKFIVSFIILKILNVVAKHNGRQKHMEMGYKDVATVDETNVSEMLESARLNDQRDSAEVSRQNARFALQGLIESTEYNVMRARNY